MDLGIYSQYVYKFLSCILLVTAEYTLESRNNAYDYRDLTKIKQRKLSWSTERPTKTSSIYLLWKDSLPDIIAGATESGIKISLIFLIAKKSPPFRVCYEGITTSGIYQLHLGHRQVLEVWIVKLISNVCRCTICGYQNPLQYHMWNQCRCTRKPHWERGHKLLEANIYLKISKRQNGTEWKILPFDFFWKIKEELFFSGLSDHQCLQLSGYQQEVIC